LKKDNPMNIGLFTLAIAQLTLVCSIAVSLIVYRLRLFGHAFAAQAASFISRS
jgi:hypothetical protein